MKHKFTKQHCENIRKSKIGIYNGNKNPNWKGGKVKLGENSNYIGIHCPTHPYCSITGYVLEHRLIMEKYLGRILLPTEIIHHINNNTKDNRIENLLLYSSQSKHAYLHNINKKRNTKGQFLKK